MGPGIPNLTCSVYNIIMCYFCGTEYTERIYRNTVCPECGKDLKICLNCKFYEPGAHWDCRETVPEPVREKDRANFCDYFVYTLRRGGGSSVKKQEESRKRFDSLFTDE
jgi:hypothetical protein